MASPELLSSMCKQFMKPIFARGRLYDDSLPCVKELHHCGYKVGVVSNTPWGCPAALWRDELSRLGLNEFVDGAVFCRDVGWRKPDGRIFSYAMRELGVRVADCVFVGDEPRWDVVGPRSVGMRSILIDRTGKLSDEYPDAIRSLNELSGRLKVGVASWQGGD